MKLLNKSGFINIFIILLLIIGLVVSLYLTSKPTNILPKAYQTNPNQTIENSSNIREYASQYINSARKNIRNLPDGKRCITPSQAYQDGIYLRDAFYAIVGLEDLSLSQDCFSVFDQTQGDNGQVRSSVPLNPNAVLFGFRDDETNLIYLIWAGILSRQGVSVNQEKIEKAYSFVNTHVQDGWYVSPAGDYRYWADTYDNKQNDTIAYNQGLYALSLRFLRELNPDLVSNEIVSKAENNYRSVFNKDGSGFLPLSKNTQYQDSSALLPEFLARLYFNQGILLPDNQVLASVDRLINIASVYDEKGKLQGIKTIYAVDGSFLPPIVFSSTMNNTGVYQNGGYWPMYVLTDLSLAFKISGDTKYKRIAQELMGKELRSDGKSKEFLYLEPYRIGTSDPERSDYSWNALISTALKWSGMTQ